MSQYQAAASDAGLVRKLQLAVCLSLLAFALPSFAQDVVSLAAKEEVALKAAAELVAPSVVQIRTIGGLDVVEETLLADGPTSGLVISADGHILSSAFNFAQKPSSILVTFADGTQAPAELVATDHSRMLVLLKATSVSDLSVPEMANSADVRPGQWAVALGRTFRADRPNITVGIVSAVGRMYGKAIQTDADVSTANYGGPLVDVHGRVLGILVPMAPQATSEVAGVEWYDSGIGFAVPVEPLSERIERMKKGEDQRAGLLGVGMQPANPHTALADLAIVRPESPAAKAGLKKGDRMVEINGKPVRTQIDMRFALGTAYAGDKTHVVVQRGDERLERTLELVGELPPLRQAFLGILPLRPIGRDDKPAELDDEKAGQPGVTVRMVYAGSPGAEAGIQAGDRLVKFNDTEIKSTSDVMDVMANISIGDKVSVQLVRAGAALELTLTASQLPANVPAELPAATVTAGDENAVVGVGETKELKLPEFAHTCQIYVPGSQSLGQPLGALLWLQSPPHAKPDDVIGHWQAAADRDGLVVVVPTPNKADHWDPTDVEYLHRLLERVVSQYKIDRRRVVVGGQGAMGAIAWPLAVTSRDLVRAVAVSAAPLPRQVKVPPHDPSRGLAIFTAIPPKKDVAAAMSVGIKKLSDAGYSVSTLTTVDARGLLSDAERNEIARWIDTLDRF